jgi:WD40 repeat protein/serine/threonine protein kinase
MSSAPVRCPHCWNVCQVAADALECETVCPHCGQPFVPSPLEDASSKRSSPWWWLSDRPAAEAPTDAWKPGDVILNLYDVREVFTGGGRGLVYRVRHRGWNMDLAVKRPRPEFFQNEQDKADFEREAETWIKLGLHPHLVACHYVRRLGGIPHVFAEYVAGGSLAEWIASRQLYAGGPVGALERILDIAIQFAWGLQHAHEQGLVHRDVKPGNVMLTNEGVAKVTDFGMAKARGSSAEIILGGTDRSVLVSAGGLTPAFCSPEQAQGRPVSRKTDIWSWGVSLLHMFNGAAHWSAGYLAAGVLEDFRRRGAYDQNLPSMPPPLAELLERCFRTNPDDRPRDMREIAGQLQRLYEEVVGRPYRRLPPQEAKAQAEVLNNRALSLCDLHKDDEAERLWNEALSVAPGHPESTYNLGLIRWRNGRINVETLRQQLQDVCTAHLGQWLPPYLLARVLMEEGDWHSALQKLNDVQPKGAEPDEIRATRAAVQECLDNKGRLLRRFSGHNGWVSSVCTATKGRMALSGSADGTLKLWNMASGQCLRTFEGHAEWVTSVGLSGDGRLALSGSADRTLRIWDAYDGRCLRILQGHTNWVLAAALSTDGLLALSGSGDGAVKLWDAAAGVCLRTFDGHEDSVLAVAFNADGSHVLSGSRDRRLILWDTQSGQRLRTFVGHADKVLAAAVSADGSFVASGSADRTLRIWDAASGRCLHVFEGHQGGVTSVCFSAGGAYLFTGSEDRSIKIWRRTTGRCLATLQGHTGTVHSLCLAGNGRRLLSASADTTLGLWSVPPDQMAPFILSRVLPSDTSLSAWNDYDRSLKRAQRAITAGDPTLAARCVREARAQPGHERRPEAMALWSELYAHLSRQALQGGWGGLILDDHSQAVTSVCLSADGGLALTGSADRTLKLWSTQEGRCLHTMEGDMGGITAVALTSDARLALSGSTDGTLKLWDLRGGECLRSCRAEVDVLTSAALSADGLWAVSAGVDGTVHRWDVSAGRLLGVQRGHTGPVHSVALRADGRFALSGGALFVVRNDGERLFTRGQLKLWDNQTGRCLPYFEDQSDPVTAVGLSPDGRFALVGTAQAVVRTDNGRFVQSGAIHLWELTSGKCVRSFEGHLGAVTSVCFSFDGRYVVSGSTDATVKLWDVGSGHCLRTFAGHADAVASVAISANGRYALSGSADRTARLWILDWELSDAAPADWDDGARPYLEMFLSLHTSHAEPPNPRKHGRSSLTKLFKSFLAEEDTAHAVNRRDQPKWTENDFQELLCLLGYAGYGWLRPEGVRRQLTRIAENWNGLPVASKRLPP